MAFSIIAIVASWPSAADAPLSSLIPFSAGEIEAVTQHGPWPPVWVGDASNRVSRSPAAIDLGARLFFDARLSQGGSVSCASCHVPEKNWSDGRKLGVGRQEMDRNTPSIANVRYHRWFGWDGANDTLWSQSMRPILEAREMAASESHIAQLMRDDRELACRYEQAFNRTLPADDELLMVDLGKALAAFQETIVTGRTAFDDFRDALARGDREAAGRYPQAAQRGAKVFVGKGSCALCHVGPNFTHGEFHEIGIPIFRKSGGVDWGRYQAIKMLKASRFNLLGAYNDDAARSTATSTRFVALHPQTFEQFKVPSLRNVALTAPYMHNGHLATLRDVVRHYSDIDPSMLHAAHVYVGSSFEDMVPDAIQADTLLKPLKLTEQEIADVVAFLETLTETGAASARRPHLDPQPCARQGARR
jgi:cytochrome c peroxidase